MAIAHSLELTNLNLAPNGITMTLFLIALIMPLAYTVVTSMARDYR